MFDTSQVPYVLDGRPPFKISYDSLHGVFKAHAYFSESYPRWDIVDDSHDFNDLFAKCTHAGMSYDGATEEALEQVRL